MRAAISIHMRVLRSIQHARAALLEAATNANRTTEGYASCGTGFAMPPGMYTMIGVSRERLTTM